MNDPRTTPPHPGATPAPQGEENWGSREPNGVAGQDMWTDLQNRKKRSETFIRLLMIVALLAALAVLIAALVIVLM